MACGRREKQEGREHSLAGWGSEYQGEVKKRELCVWRVEEDLLFH